MRKPLFVVSDLVSLNFGCSVTERLTLSTSLNNENLEVARIGFMLSNQQTTMALIRMGGCTYIVHPRILIRAIVPMLIVYDTENSSYEVAPFILCLLL